MAARCQRLTGAALSVVALQADKELPGVVVSKVLESMDVHGRLTLDQFLAIVDVRACHMHATGPGAVPIPICI